jgi:hypothetical protein
VNGVKEDFSLYVEEDDEARQFWDRCLLRKRSDALEAGNICLMRGPTGNPIGVILL